MPFHEISLDPLERWLNALWLGYMYYAVTTKKDGGRGDATIRIVPRATSARRE
jgi:hypothetical protein